MRILNTDYRHRGEHSKLSVSIMKLSDFNAKQWRVLLILMLVNFVNYVDRQIVFALFPYLRHDFGLTRLQFHAVAPAAAT